MRRAPRKSILGLLGVAGAAAVSLPIIALGGPGPQAPDLRADPVEDVRPLEIYNGPVGPSGRLIVRFDGFVTNVGQGVLEIRGNPQIPGNVKQYARTGPGQPANTVVGTPPIAFDAGDGHAHFHLGKVMRYSLWNSARTAPVVPGSKVGFCLYDSEFAPQPSPAPNPATAVYTDATTEFCESGQPSSTGLLMGTSSGWRDEYYEGLAYQWVDLTDVAPGLYYLASEADPDNVIWEGGGAGEAPSIAFNTTQPVTVPGFLAQPISGPQTGAAQPIALSTQKFGGQSDGERRFRILTPPSNGTLSVAPNTDFTNPVITYTPNPGYKGADSFTYAGIRSGWGYPSVPAPATVSLTSTQPAIAISGAPASMAAGTSVQLTASLANLPAGVAWSATAGSISPNGLFKAPPAVPTGGGVTITARSTANAAIGATAGILITPAPKGPRPGVSGTLSAGNKLISRVAIRQISRRVFVSKIVTGRKKGTVRITTTIGPKVLDRCTARLPARTAFSCKTRLKRNYPLKKVRVTAKITVKGGGSAVRRSFVAR